jgi:hypothetical protein
VGSVNRFARPIATKAKTSGARVVFLCDQAYNIRSVAGKVPDHRRVFTFRGRPLEKIMQAFTTAWQKIGIRACRFHKLGHPANPRRGRRGLTTPVITKHTVPETSSRFRRYHLVDVNGPKLSYRRLEELLSQEDAENAARTKKCSQAAPDREGKKVKIISS